MLRRHIVWGFRQEAHGILRRSYENVRFVRPGEIASEFDSYTKMQRAFEAMDPPMMMAVSKNLVRLHGQRPVSR